MFSCIRFVGYVYDVLKIWLHLIYRSIYRITKFSCIFDRMKSEEIAWIPWRSSEETFFLSVVGDRRWRLPPSSAAGGDQKTANLPAAENRKGDSISSLFFSQPFFLIFWMENMFNIDNDIEMVSLFYYYYTMADWLMLFWFSLYFMFIIGFFNRCQCGCWRVFVYSYNRINIPKMSNTYIYFPISL